MSGETLGALRTVGPSGRLLVAAALAAAVAACVLLAGGGTSTLRVAGAAVRPQAPAAGGAAGRLQAELAYSRRLQAGAQRILDQTLGAGRAAIVVDARLDLDTVSQRSTSYGAVRAPLRVAQQTQRATAPGGIESVRLQRVNALDQTVTQTRGAGGTPGRVLAALTFAAPRGGSPTRAEMQQAASAVRQYLGILPIDLARGTDALAVTYSSHALGGAAASPVGVDVGGRSAALVALLTAVLLLAAAAGRSRLRRRARVREADERHSASSQTRADAGDELIGLTGVPTQAEIDAAQRKALQRRVEEIAGARPGDVARQIRGWLAEEA